LVFPLVFVLKSFSVTAGALAEPDRNSLRASASIEEKPAHHPGRAFIVMKIAA
jgi:hypothetical protein